MIGIRSWYNTYEEMDYVKEYKLESLHNKLGYIPQKAVMFNGTISSNISYDESNQKKPSKAKIKEAIKVAQAEEFVTKMEKSYDAHIAQGGTNISGGQKQRLSIARAIARDPEIYIFDDSFSALDYKTDVTLRKELKKYTINDIKTVIDKKTSEWINNPKMKPYLTPETLFGPKFERYLHQNAKAKTIQDISLEDIRRTKEMRDKQNG